MFQRIKGAIDRTIAEEQARQVAADTASPRASSSVSRSASFASTTRKPRPKKAPQDVGKEADAGAADTDPAVFEAAFVIDDEELSRSATPQPTSASEKTAENGNSTNVAGVGEKGDTESGDTTKDPEKNGDIEGRQSEGDKPVPPLKTTATELPPDIRAKLRKLDKLEKTYPELLRSYRIAHGRATSIEPFERALRETTPLTTIKDPDALTEYLSQLSLKGEMVMDELKRVSTEREDFKKKYEAADQEIAQLKEQVASLEAAKSVPEAADGGTVTTSEKEEVGTQTSPKASAVMSPVQSVLGIFSPKQKPVKDEGAEPRASDDLFSYDNEIPQLQADVEAKTNEIEKLKSEVEGLRSELATAKENSAGLAEHLEKVSRELSESRDDTAVKESLQTQVSARDIEIKTLTERLGKSEEQLKDLQTQLGKEKAATTAAIKEKEKRLAETSALHSELEAGLKKVTEAKAALDTRIVDLTTEIKTLRKSKTENEQKIEELSKQLQTAPPTPSTTAPSEYLEVPSSATPASASSKKKNKKKKGKGGAGAPAADIPTAGDAPSEPPASPALGPTVSELQAEIVVLKQDATDKDGQIERLAKQRQTEEDLREEIESLRDNLLEIGQEHVTAKDKIKTLEAEKKQLQERIAELEKALESSSSTAESNSQLQSEYKALKQEFDDIKIKSATLQSDLGAAQNLAQSRYKDLAELREVLQKAQPELKSLRLEAANLKSTKDELNAKAAELRAMEKREKELKTEVSRAQRLATDRETEIKSLRDKLQTETNNRLRLEDAQRVSGRDLRRAENEKIELSAASEKAGRELVQLQNELAKLRPRVKELEDEAAKLRKESDIHREDSELKTSQYTNAQNLLGSMRDQTHELSVQLKESQAQAESLEEEIGETRKLLGERTREAETMRRLLNEADERATSKTRSLQDRLEEAEKERDKFEHEMLSTSRKTHRQIEDLNHRIRELTREAKTLAEEKDELAHKEKEWRRRREELEAVEARAEAEVSEMRATVGNLRGTLDASEQQVREAEKAKSDLRRTLDEYRIRYDKLAKEHKAAQAQLSNARAGVGSPATTTTGRTSMDSTRSVSVAGGGGGGGGGGGTPDTVYLKTIMLQFLEQKDNKLRAQLVPVLGKLLKFDKADEQKWNAAVSQIGAR